MYTISDFVEMMENGRTMEQIADELTIGLNAAKAEMERREALQKEAKRQIDRRNDYLTELYHLLTNYLLEFYPDVEILTNKEEPSEEDLKNLADQLDSLVQTYKAVVKIQEEIRDEPIWDEFMKLFIV